MSIERIADIGFGMEFGPWSPDTALGVASEAARSVGWVGGQRFTSHEGAREEGLPGALVPGILGMGFLCALIHRHIPAARIEHIDTVFRAPLIADEPCEVSAVVTDIDEDERRAELDLHVRNAAGETRIFGNATIRMPA
ncbi:MAG: hypothetical protein H6993_09320 [Pseudomonadales bacterium]|nr:hypothetical protein [Pseudomonadales bacterium]MCP5184150.1 hypothetical protein [Pseudomonadales bacterium]